MERTTANSKPLAALYTASGEPLCASLTNLAVFCTSRVRRIAEAMFTAMVECRGYLGQWWQCVEKDVVDFANTASCQQSFRSAHSAPPPLRVTLPGEPHGRSDILSANLSSSSAQMLFRGKGKAHGDVPEFIAGSTIEQHQIHVVAPC